MQAATGYSARCSCSNTRCINRAIQSVQNRCKSPLQRSQRHCKQRCAQPFQRSWLQRHTARLREKTDTIVRRSSQNVQEAEAEKLQPLSSRVAGLLLRLALCGAILGPPLDGIHTNAQLLQYDSVPLTIGSLHTSAWIPPLLALYYSVAGSLVPLLDTYWGGAATEQLNSQLSWPQVALGFGVLAGLLEFSSLLYGSGVAYPQMFALLAPAALLNWKVFDGTRQGLALALACGIGAPLFELVIMRYWGWWHYSQPDVFGPLGIPSWVTCCYFFYTPALSNLARLLWRSTSQKTS